MKRGIGSALFGMGRFASLGADNCPALEIRREAQMVGPSLFGCRGEGRHGLCLGEGDHVRCDRALGLLRHAKLGVSRAEDFPRL